MPSLHIVNKSPYEKRTLDTAIGYIRAGDTLLLIEDAVYAAAKGGAATAKLAGLNTAGNATVRVTVLGPDLAARGIGAERLVDGVKVVDYAGFVDLVEAADTTQSWL